MKGNTNWVRGCWKPGQGTSKPQTRTFDLHTGSKCHKSALTLEMGNDIAKFFGGACATPTALGGERHPNSAASSTDQNAGASGGCMCSASAWY